MAQEGPSLGHILGHIWAIPGPHLMAQDRPSRAIPGSQEGPSLVHILGHILLDVFWATSGPSLGHILGHILGHVFTQSCFPKKRD